MTGPLLAEFRDPETLQHAVGRVKQAHHRALDAFTPYPVEGLAEELAVEPSRIRTVMLAGGLLVAAFAFALQWYSAVIDYPINSGGRPLNSWQVFWLVPFEVGMFAAALCGVIALLLVAAACRACIIRCSKFQVSSARARTGFSCLPPPSRATKRRAIFAMCWKPPARLW